MTIKYNTIWIMSIKYCIAFEMMRMKINNLMWFSSMQNLIKFKYRFDCTLSLFFSLSFYFCLSRSVSPLVGWMVGVICCLFRYDFYDFKPHWSDKWDFLYEIYKYTRCLNINAFSWLITYFVEILRSIWNLS